MRDKVISSVSLARAPSSLTCKASSSGEAVGRGREEVGGTGEVCDDVMM